MARYLLIAHQTADCPALVTAAQRLATEDPEAEFVVVAPVRPVGLSQLVAGEHRNSSEIARWRARRTAQRVASAGCKVVAARQSVSDLWLDAVEVIEHELRYDSFRAVVISTLPHPFSAWLHADVPSKLARRWPEIEMMHVTTPAWSFLEEGPDPKAKEQGAPGPP